MHEPIHRRHAHRKGRSGKQPGIRPAKRCNGLLPQRIQAGSTQAALVQHMPERAFSLHDAATGQTVYQGTASPLNQDKKLDKGFLVLDFSSFNTPGQYFLSIGDVQSKPFPIGMMPTCLPPGTR